MASRPQGYGMTAELERKKSAKFDPALATMALQWIVDVLNSGSGPSAHELAQNIKLPVSREDDVKEPLRDGIILCELVNILKPGSVRKINNNKMAFKQMENIGNFLEATAVLGCVKADMFQTVDLFEGQNISQVINGIFAVGRKASKFNSNVPRLGQEEASENRRQFTEEQLRAGDGVIGLQAGSNKGASQAGQSFGKTRMIID